MKSVHASLAATLVALSLCACALAGETAKPVNGNLFPDVPAWLGEAMRAPVGNLAENADAVWLAKDKTLDVRADGSFHYEDHLAVKILRENGSSLAMAKIYFNSKKDDVSGVKAWLVQPDGKVHNYGRLDFYVFENRDPDMKDTTEMVYYLDLSKSAQPGSVFAWSYELVRKYTVMEDVWFPTDSIPTLHTSVDITIPRSWTLTPTPANNPQYTTSGTPTSGTSYKFECTNQPALLEEDGTPKDQAVPFVGFNFYSPDNEPGQGKSWTYKTWMDVATFEASYMDETVTVNDAIRAKVAELTKDCDTPYKRIQAVCRYVQQINHIKTDWGATNGLLGNPDSAPVVFAHNYGDCKNMVTLLRAMLSCIGVESYTVECATSSKTSPAWPSPTQLYDCVVAIKAPEGVETAADLNIAPFGRLIFFDPNNSHLAVGAFPENLEDLDLLILSMSTGSLVRAPSAHASETINWKGELDAQGNLTGSVQIRNGGGIAATPRQCFHDYQQSDIEALMTKFLCVQARETKIKSLTLKDNFEDNEPEQDLTIQALGYAHKVGGNLLTFSVFVDSFSLHTPGRSGNGKRLTPYYLKACEYNRDTDIAIPKDFIVDELPDDVSEKSDFGTIELHCTSNGNTIHAHFEIKLKDLLVPAGNVDALRDFLMDADRALQAAAVIRPGK
jgi:hypothetical protein